MIKQKLIQMYRITSWLTLCCCLLLASSKLARVAVAAEQTFSEQSGGLMGITFPAVRSGGGGGGGLMSDGRQQTGNIDESLKRALLLRELDLDSNSPQARQLSNKELLRRVRLNQLLATISASIPSAAATISTAPSTASGAVGGNSMNQAPILASQVPIYRNSRTYPSARSDISTDAFNNGDNNNNNYRSLRLAPIASGGSSDYAPPSTQRLRSEMEQWEPSGSMLDGRTGSAKSRKSSGILGIVWPNDRPLGSSGTPPYYTSPTTAAAIARKQANTISRQQQQQGEPSGLSTIYGANQQRSRSIAAPQHKQQQSTGQHHHHRSGTEEVALHTPSHSQSQSDYEWKRVENSRWSNLRGMWGKRAAMRDDESLAQKYKELLESESDLTNGGQSLDSEDDNSESNSANHEHEHEHERPLEGSVGVAM